MKAVLCLIYFSLSSLAWTQVPENYIKNFESKIYSLKNKGVKNFVVDLESTNLTKQLNDQQLFGKVDQLLFRIFWTVSPERLAVEVIGLPDGFVEIKQQLKLGLISYLEVINPQSLIQKFNGHKMSQGQTTKEILVQDVSGVAAIPGYLLKFDQQDRLVEVIGRKPVGLLSIKPTYEKESFSDGKWVLKEEVKVNSESGVTSTTRKNIFYGESSGMTVPTKIDLTTQQTSENPQIKPLTISDSVEFKNYKINDGSALKYFLSESSLNQDKK